MIKKVNFSNFFELWIASRYIRLKNKNNFISFISLTSIIGITLGVMALIIVLSVMNGFQSELKNKILSVASDIEVTGSNYLLRDWKNNNELIQKQNNVSSVAPFT
ncbi:MAG: ABC transporter permease, partial [Methylophilaceae bacterium]